MSDNPESGTDIKASLNFGKATFSLLSQLGGPLVSWGTGINRCERSVSILELLQKSRGRLMISPKNTGSLERLVGFQAAALILVSVA